MTARPMMRRARTLLLAAGVAAVPAAAQWEELEQLPGYFPLEEMAILDPDELTVEINLTGPMLRLVASFAGEGDPELAALVEGLDAVRVRSGELAEADREAVRSRVQAAGRWLDERGWAPMVRVREPGEEVLIYSRPGADGVVEGMTVVALEGSEVTVVNLIGRVDPAQLGRIVAGLDLPLGAVGDDDDADEEGER